MLSVSIAAQDGHLLVLSGERLKLSEKCFFRIRFTKPHHHRHHYHRHYHHSDILYDDIHSELRPTEHLGRDVVQYQVKEMYS